jgi:hypothetical protein
LVDEVLAVGDEAFQRKCLDRVAEFQSDGRTIVVVSHSPDLVRRICQSATVLDHGAVVASGDPEESVKVFREHLRMAPARPRPGEPPPVDDQIRVTDVHLDHPGLPERTYLEPGEPLAVRISFVADVPVDDPVFTIMIFDNAGQVLHGSSTLSEGVKVGHIKGVGEITFAFEQIPLFDGEYAITVCATSGDGELIYDWHEQRYRFEVRDSRRTFDSAEFPVVVTLTDPNMRGSAATR